MVGSGFGRACVELGTVLGSRGCEWRSSPGRKPGSQPCEKAEEREVSSKFRRVHGAEVTFEQALDRNLRRR